jgi:hypothetical protein
MAKEAPIEKITVVVNGKNVLLDPENMKYSENSLPEYLNKEYGWIDYLGKQLEFAQKELLLADIEAKAIEAKKFIESKDEGNTDNYAKAYSLCHVDVVDCKKKVADLKATVGHLKAHLLAWKENHENANNRGHSLRHEMKVLHREYYETPEEPCSADDFLKEKND